MRRFLIALLCLLPATATAQISGPPYTFTNDTVADADEVNANFAALFTGAVSRTAGSMLGHLTFGIDNTWDIGASGATRPRDLFLARNLTVGGAFTLTGAFACSACVDATQLAATAVTAGSYGGNSIPLLTVDADGRVTAASDTSLSSLNVAFTNQSHTITGSYTFTQPVTLSSVAPLMRWHQTDGAANGKWWATVADSTVLDVRAYSDDLATYTSAVTYTRSGATVTGVDIWPNTTISGAFTAVGAVAIGGNLTTTGSISAASLTTSGSAIVGNDLAITDEASVGGNLTVTGSMAAGSITTNGTASLNGNATVGGDLSVVGTLSTGNLSPSAITATNHYGAVQTVGTISSPSYAFTGETDTGMAMFSPSGDSQLSMVVDGTRVINFDNGLITNYLSMAPSTTGTHQFGTAGLRYSTIYLTSAPDVSSDQRVKRDISPLALGLHFVNQLRPVTYRLTAQPARQQYGFVAQDVQALGFEAVNASDPEHLGMNYDAFIAPLVKAVQELSAKLEAAEARIRVLEGR